MQLRLAGIRLGPGGVAALRSALARLDSRLRRAGIRLGVSCAERLPAAAVPESLWEDG